MKKFYDTREASMILEVPQATIIHWIKKGALRAFKLGNKWRIPREELLRLLAPLGPAAEELLEFSTAQLHVKPQHKAVRVREQRATERLREQRVTERREGKRAK